MTNNKLKNFYLLCDSSVMCSYLVCQWLSVFRNSPSFQGVILREDVQPDSVLQARKNFHTQYSGQKYLTDEGNQILMDLYPDLSKIEQAMIERNGIAPYPATGSAKNIFLGENINGKYAQEWLREASKDSPPFIFVFLTRILKSWWIEMTQSQLINGHSAVLPYARGRHSIEHLAILGDIDQFRKAAGITIHYIDKGVDTGDIIRAQRIIDPFQFDSIWDLKAYIYFLEFDIYVKTAQEILEYSQTIPAGICQNPELQGHNFRIAQFTPQKQMQAEQGYLLMKSIVKSDI